MVLGMKKKDLKRKTILVMNGLVNISYFQA